MGIRYKFLEVTPVTDDQLEKAVNAWAQYGWCLDKIHFIMRDNSHRPALAFVTLIRSDRTLPEPDEPEEAAAPSDPLPEAPPETRLEPHPLDVDDLLAEAALEPSIIEHDD